jgi:hypothetical protein
MYRWFWKCGILIFFCRQITLWVISRDILRGPRLFWPLNCPKMAHKLIFLKTKNNIPNFQDHRYIGNFMSHYDQLPTIFNLLHLHIILSLYVYQLRRHRHWVLIVDRFLFSQIFLGVQVHCAGHKVGGIHFKYCIRTLCPAHEKNAGD